MKLINLSLTAFVAGSLMAACGSQPAGKAYIAGHVNDYPGKGYLLLINQADTAHTYDTLSVAPDGTFIAEITTKGYTERGLYLEYLGDNRSMVNCFVKAGDTLKVDIKGKTEEMNFMGTTIAQYKSTPAFTGSTAKESEFLNLPPYYDFTFKKEDGTPVSFKDYQAQMAKAIDERANMLDGTEPGFMARQKAALDRVPESYNFVYAWRLRNDGNDPLQDADFMKYAFSVDVNDTANYSRHEQFSPTAHYIRFVLELLKPDLYKDEPRAARELCYLRDSVSNPVVREWVSDNTMSMMMAMGDNDGLVRCFEIYKGLSGKSELYKENEKIYNSLSKLLPGVKATDFDMQDVDGKTVRFLDVIGQGKVTYIDFWATWCGPCCAEIPHVAKLVEKYKNNPNIEFLSISLDDKLKKWHDKLDEDKPQWRQFIIPDNFKSVFAKEYNIRAIPRFMMFDTEGRIININAERPSNPNIEQILNGILGKK